MGEGILMTVVVNPDGKCVWAGAGHDWPIEYMDGEREEYGAKGARVVKLVGYEELPLREDLVHRLGERNRELKAQVEGLRAVLRRAMLAAEQSHGTWPKLRKDVAALLEPKGTDDAPE